MYRINIEEARSVPGFRQVMEIALVPSGQTVMAEGKPTRDIEIYVDGKYQGLVKQDFPEGGWNRHLIITVEAMLFLLQKVQKEGEQVLQ